MDDKKHSSLDQLADFIDFRKLIGVISENIFSVIAIVVFFFSAWLAYLNFYFSCIYGEKPYTN